MVLLCSLPSESGDSAQQPRGAERARSGRRLRLCCRRRGERRCSAPDPACTSGARPGAGGSWQDPLAACEQAGPGHPSGSAAAAGGSGSPPRRREMAKCKVLLYPICSTREPLMRLRKLCIKPALTSVMKQPLTSPAGVCCCREPAEMKGTRLGLGAAERSRMLGLGALQRPAQGSARIRLCFAKQSEGGFLL